MMGTYESDPFASVHLTEKYALIAAIQDVMDFLGINDTEDFESRYCSEPADGLVVDHDAMKEMEAPQLRPIFLAWTQMDGVWDNCQGYSVTVMKTKVTA
tara:strand:- start:212 stop:508 length:297 start_codon:yes stop_codon:yes gene_type:complete